MEIETEDTGDYDIHAHHNGIDGGARWERSMLVECECGSADTEADVTGDMLMLVCFDCANWYVGHVRTHVSVDESGEIRTSDWQIPFRLVGRANRW